MTSNHPNESFGFEADQKTIRSASHFSIRAMMIAMAIVALLCCIFFTLPSWAGGLFLLIATLLLMPAMLAALVYGTGRTRAFAVGASPPICIVFMMFTGLAGRRLPFYNFVADDWQSKILFSVVIITIVVSGFVGQLVRWWCLRIDAR